MNICTFASGSSGNCGLVRAGRTCLLLDAGISARRIGAALASLGVCPEELGGVLVTHEHSDHISGIEVLTRRWGVPVYATAGTARQLCYRIAGLEPSLRTFSAGESFRIGEIAVRSFPTSHDAAESVGYVLESGERRAALCTDLGYLSREVLDAVPGAHLVICEANHDEDWVRSGPYPFPLRKRILGEQGHLSNESGGALALRCAQAGAHTILLAHLSGENNSPEHALDVVGGILTGGGYPPGKAVTLACAPRGECSPVYEV